MKLYSFTCKSDTKVNIDFDMQQANQRRIPTKRKCQRQNHTKSSDSGTETAEPYPVENESSPNEPTETPSTDADSQVSGLQVSTTGNDLMMCQISMKVTGI